jgi:hypothetical protein
VTDRLCPLQITQAGVELVLCSRSLPEGSHLADKFPRLFPSHRSISSWELGGDISHLGDVCEMEFLICCFNDCVTMALGSERETGLGRTQEAARRPPRACRPESK